MIPGITIAEQDAQALRLLYAEHFGCPAEDVIPLRGDGSDRQIVRLRSRAGSSIGIVGPDLAENRAFIGFTRSFASIELPVPEIYTVHPSGRWYLEEDLGDVTLADWQEEQRDGDAFPAHVTRMYVDVLRTLVRFQIDAADTVDYGLCYQHPEFGTEAMIADMSYFRTMFLGHFYTGSLDEILFQRDADTFVRHLLEEPRSHFLYRDFQSRNIMITPRGPRYIDYQSGRRGALQYDAASLLYDSRSKLSPEIRQVLLHAYMDEVMLRVPIDRDNFLLRFDGFAILRLMQALGAFGKLGILKKKLHFLPLIPSRLRHLSALVRSSELMRRTPYLEDLLLEITESSDALRFQEYAG